jgi:hypothetical protein
MAASRKATASKPAIAPNGGLVSLWVSRKYASASVASGVKVAAPA